MTDDPQTDPEEAVDAGAETADTPPDAAAAEAAAAAADDASDAAVESVKAGEDPPQALATPHGHDGDFDPLAEAESLPEAPPEPEAAGDDVAADDDAADDDAADDDAGDEISAEAEPPDAEAEPPDAEGDADAGDDGETDEIRRR